MTFNAVVNALYSAGGPMTTHDLEQAVSDDRNASALTSDVVNSMEAFSPIRRVSKGLYDLTGWARARLGAGGVLTHPRDTIVPVPTVPPERHASLVEALVAFLYALPESVQEAFTFAELLQAFGSHDAHHEQLVTVLRPRDLLPALSMALARYDQETSGKMLIWLPEGSTNDLQRARAATVLPAFDITTWSPSKRVEVLCAYLNGTFAQPNVDALADFTLDDGTRVHLGQPGQHITRQMVAALHDECGVGEPAMIYALGHVTDGARKAAARLKVTIHHEGVASRILSDAGFGADLDAELALNR